MKNLLLIFLLAPLLSAAQVPPKPNTNAVAQAVTLVGTNIMPIAVRPIVEGWFAAGVTTQDVESAISARGYTTTNDVLNLTAGFVSETSPPYTNLLAIATMALRVYETNGVWKTLLPGEALP
jgi:hypothetical protein